VRKDLLDRPFEDRHGRVEELVDRRADHNDYLARAAQHLGGRAQLDAPRRKQFTQKLVGASLEERHFASADLYHRRFGYVDDANAKTSLGKSQT
jgi:hypothetical protein